MRKAISTLLALGVATSMLADDYKILQMNTSTIQIGSRICKTGDTFSDDSTIVWTRQKQALKAQNVQSKEIHLFVEPEFHAKNYKTVKDYYLKTNHLSTRATGLSLEELTEYLNSKTFYLLDTTRIESPIPLDSTRNYYLVYDSCEKGEKHQLKSESNSFLILRSQLLSCDSSKERVVSILFTCKGVDEDYLLTDSMKIVILPLFLK